MKALLPLFLFIITFAQAQESLPPIIEMTQGETITVDGHDITFTNVIDSRCPPMVTCIWEGYVEVEIQIDNNPPQRHKLTDRVRFGLDTVDFEVDEIIPYETNDGLLHTIMIRTRVLD